ncbi:hypothetical protein [Pseudosulfitobacter pseudonitzschiae]|uniref:hypothetical protein n=1 Tax=Pseudosulfitobacter pseudonitzschiae TaxID=1402135 RepID=UPI003B7E8948
MSDKTEAFKEDFAQDVPAHMHDEILERIVEAAWEFSEDPEISIFDCEKRNVTNIEFSGTIMIQGQEHCFHMRDGDNNGTEILSWNEGIHFEHAPQIERALIPFNREVSDAIYSGRAQQMLEKWDRDMDPGTERGAVISKLAGSFAYDSFFAPGSGAARSHAIRAEDYGYEISEREVAEKIRKYLLFEALCLRPAGDWPRKTPEAARHAYGNWTDYRQAQGEITKVLIKTADRLSKEGGLSPSFDERAEMRALGFNFATRGEEAAAWKLGLSGLYELSDIEGFDPKTLPEDPVKGLFHALDPALVVDRRVNPQHEAARTLDAVTNNMARERRFEITEDDREAFTRFGFAFHERGPEGWIVDEQGNDIALYRERDACHGTDGRRYRIEGGSVLCLSFDPGEGCDEVIGEFDLHDHAWSSREADSCDVEP